MGSFVVEGGHKLRGEMCKAPRICDDGRTVAVEVQLSGTSSLWSSSTIQVRLIPRRL